MSSFNKLLCILLTSLSLKLFGAHSDGPGQIILIRKSSAELLKLQKCQNEHLETLEQRGYLDTTSLSLQDRLTFINIANRRGNFSTAQFLLNQWAQQTAAAHEDHDENQVLLLALEFRNTCAFKFFLKHFKKEELLHILAHNEALLPQLVLENQRPDHCIIASRGWNGTPFLVEILIKAAVKTNDIITLNHYLHMGLEYYHWLELVEIAIYHECLTSLEFLLSDKRFNEHSYSIMRTAIKRRKAKSVEMILALVQANSQAQGKIKGAFKRVTDYFAGVPSLTDLAFFFGVTEGQLEIVEQALAQGANPNFIFEDFYMPKKAPLLLAAYAGHAAIVKILLSHKATKSTLVAPALVQALEGGNVAAVKILLQDKRSNLQFCRDELMNMMAIYPELRPHLPKDWFIAPKEKGCIN